MTALQPLFSRPNAFILRGFSRLPGILDAVMPMTAAQRRELPLACRDLSAMLTTDRDALSRPYWSSPRLISAYLRYFLPWNLVRLATLLPGLDFGGPNSPDGDIPAEPLILDLGSGPLTLPLALWLSRPDLRTRPVTVVCSDTAPHPLDLGRAILDAMRSELDPGSPWTIRLMRAPAHTALRQVRGRPWMLTLGNVLNELEDKDRRRPGQRNEGQGLQQKLREFLGDAAAVLPPEGRILAVEPGTRQGGRLIAELRRLALDPRMADDDAFWDDESEDDVLDDGEDFTVKSDSSVTAPAGKRSDKLDPSRPFLPLAPCPQDGPCPMLTRGVTAWCHVNAPAENVPAALRDLSRKAGLDKDSVSLSFLLLRRPPLGDTKNAMTSPHADTPEQLRVRVVSDPFVLPAYPGRARYACSSFGLALVPDSAFLPAGCLCNVNMPRPPVRDAKSGALITTLPGWPGKSASADRPCPTTGARALPQPGETQVFRSVPLKPVDKANAPRSEKYGEKEKSTDKKRVSKNNSPHSSKHSKKEPKTYFGRQN